MFFTEKHFSLSIKKEIYYFLKKNLSVNKIG